MRDAEQHHRACLAKVEAADQHSVGLKMHCMATSQHIIHVGTNNSRKIIPIGLLGCLGFSFFRPGKRGKSCFARQPKQNLGKPSNTSRRWDRWIEFSALKSPHLGDARGSIHAVGC